MTRASETGFFVHGSETYRYRLSSAKNGVSTWAVTRTEATLVETPQEVEQSTLESIIAADFDGRMATSLTVFTTAIDQAVGDEAIRLAAAESRPAEVCGACGSYVPGGSDPAVMSAHDCDGEED